MADLPADVIITEFMMTPVDGLEFVRLVRTGSDSPNPFVPIIMLTAYTERRNIMQARDAGITEFLAKPISARSLYARLHSAVFRPRPFIKVTQYFGPDRRRHASAKPSGRRTSPYRSLRLRHNSAAIGA